jgi:hypothetical protein
LRTQARAIVTLRHVKSSRYVVWRSYSYPNCWRRPGRGGRLDSRTSCSSRFPAPARLAREPTSPPRTALAAPGCGRRKRRWRRCGGWGDGGGLVDRSPNHGAAMEDGSRSRRSGDDYAPGFRIGMPARVVQISHENARLTKAAPSFSAQSPWAMRTFSIGQSRMRLSESRARRRRQKLARHSRGAP